MEPRGDGYAQLAREIRGKRRRFERQHAVHDVRAFYRGEYDVLYGRRESHSRPPHYPADERE